MSCRNAVCIAWRSIRLAEMRYSEAEPRAGRTEARRQTMIKPRRIGHATFETPDLDKAIAYYEKFMGLMVAEREKDRAFLATKIGLLVDPAQQVRSRALHQAVVRGGAQFRFRRDGAGAWRRTASAASCATIPFPAWGRCCRSRTTRAPPSSCSRTGAISASTSRSPASGRSSSGTSPSLLPTSRRRWRSTRRCWASASPTGSATSSASCAATPTITP